MTKLLKVRILLPVLLLGYVLLGGLVVPYVDRAVGHGILLALSVLAMVLTLYAFHRYDTYYREASIQTKVFVGTVTVLLAIVLVAIYHIVAIVVGLKSILEMYAGELTLVVLAVTVWLIYENNRPDKA
jgi:hypothetical protein